MMPSDYLALQEASKAQILREAAAGWGSVVDRTEYLYDDSSFGYSRSLPFTSADDRKGGAFRPVYYTETDLAAIRAQVRNLWGITPIPNGVVETLANYTFGTGIGYTVQSEVDNPRLLTAIQKTIDQFVKDHGLDGDMDREIHRRTREDGEAFVRLRWIDGRVNAQFIEPDCIKEPGNPLSVEEYCGLEAGGCWRFGVHTDSDDTSNVRGYYVYWGESDRDWEYVPECRMGHFKRNVTAAAKRGVSDFYDLISDLYNEARLTGNATSGAALQAAIAWIRQTPAGTTQSQAKNVGATGAVRTASRPNASGGTSLSNVGRYTPNTILTVPAGQEYKPGPLGAERNAGFDLIGQRVLKRCGVRWSMPEGMISGDASNNNYASALVAQSPFVKGRQADQTWYGKRTISLLWKVIRLAWEHGRFDRYGVSIEQMMEHCDITASYPTVENMDPLQQVQVQKAQRELGILSLTTAAKQAGYDLEEEQRLGAKAPEPAPQMPPGMMPGQMHPAMLAQQSKLAGQVPNPALENDAVSESFDESKVNRHPAGSASGGEFAPKGGGGKQIESKEFKAWFGDSKVVDDNGKPLIVYHGATQEFDEFRDNAFFTSDPTVSDSFATSRAENAGEDNPAPRIIPAYLSIKKPFVIDAGGKHAGEIQFASMDRYGYRKALSSSKYDGVIIKGTKDEGDLYVAKKPSQIKSATGNRGKFDPNSGNINESVEVPESALECGSDMRQAVAIALESAGTTAEARAILEQLLEFDESKVNRHPGGTSDGGQFAPKGGGVKKIALSSLDKNSSRELSTIEGSSLANNSDKPVIVIKNEDGTYKLLDGFGRSAGVRNAGGDSVHAIEISKDDLRPGASLIADDEDVIGEIHYKYAPESKLAKMGGSESTGIYYNSFDDASRHGKYDPIYPFMVDRDSWVESRVKEDGLSRAEAMKEHKDDVKDTLKNSPDLLHRFILNQYPDLKNNG